MSELRLNLDLLESNARQMAECVAAFGKQWRPQVKAAWQPDIAKLLLKSGAIGITTETVGQVEALAEAGIPSILFAHVAVAEDQLRRLAIAARTSEVILIVDHFVQAEFYSRAALQHTCQFRFLVEVNVGMNRTGCRPRVDASQLAQAAGRLPGLQFAGIIGNEAHLASIGDYRKKRNAVFEAMGTLQQTREAMLSVGLECEIVSAGATGVFEVAAEHSVVTEIQADCLAFREFTDPHGSELLGGNSVLIVVADVISRPSLEQAVLNVSLNTIDTSAAIQRVVGIDGAGVAAMYDEHTVLLLEGDSRDVKIGQQVQLAVAISNRTVLMHRQIHVYRGDELLDVWPVICRS